MIELKVKGTGSWLDPVSARALSANLSAALWERCRGHRGLFVTLTYRREDYADALQLYRRQADERHVREFLRRVGRRLGESLTGRWFCKMEFQKGGWVHWHVLILDVAKIPHDELTELWGRGHVWVRRLNRRNVRYCTKYTSKAGDVPAWLLGERPRSVKVVRVSPGFWRGRAGGTPPDRRPPSEPDPLDGPRQRLDFYVPIGTKIEASCDDFVARDQDGVYVHGKADLGPLLAALLLMGCGIVGKRNGWLVVDADLTDLDRAVERTPRRAPTRKRWDPAAAEPPPLHLNTPSNPHTQGWPKWLDRWMWSHAEGGAA